MVAAPSILNNEAELFLQMAEGSEAAFTEIFYHYTGRIYNTIFAIAKSHQVTEEIVQEVFIKLWHKRQHLAGITNYKAYITSMAANKTYDWLRKMASDEKLKQHTWHTLKDYSNITEETLDFNECNELIEEVVERLSPQRKKIYRLSRQQGLSRAEIAAELNLSVYTVNNHLNEAISFIKEQLQNIPGISITLIMILIRIRL